MRRSTCCCCLLAVVAACWLSLPAFQYILLLVPVTARCTVPMWCPTPLPLQLVDAVAVAVSWLMPSFFLLLVCYNPTWFHFHCCLVLFLSLFPFDFCGSCHRFQCWLPTRLQLLVVTAKKFAFTADWLSPFFMLNVCNNLMTQALMMVSVAVSTTSWLAI